MRDTSHPKETEGRVFPVPYVPTLGPMHPDTLTPHLWDEVVRVARTGRFLAHDKDARWGGTKAERVLHHVPGESVATLLERGQSRTVRVHLYGPCDLDRGADRTAKLAAEHGADRAQLVRLTLEAQQGRCCRIQLRTFTSGAQRSATNNATELDRLPGAVQATWTDFADAMAGEGFAFLAAQERAGVLDGPVLTVVQDGRVVGAIGPMSTRPDPLGRLRLLPQYFGVLPSHRGRGHGRTLWRAAMAWGLRSGAAYQLLQTELGGASDRLCQEEGLETLGFVTTIDI